MKTLRILFETTVASIPSTHVFLRWHEAGQWHVRTYGEVQRRVRALSEWLGEQGVQRGQVHVGLLLPNGPAWIETYLAVTGLGGVVVPIDPKLTPSELALILADAEVRILVTTAALAHVLETIQSSVPALCQLLLIDEGGSHCLPVATYETVIQRVAEDQPLRFWNDPAWQPTPEDVASIIYTSGTTGRPKGAMLTHQNFISDAEGCLTLIQGYVCQADDFFVVLPLFHAFCFTANFLVALRAGAALTFMQSLRMISDNLQTLHPTVLMTVPLMIEKIHTHLMSKIQASWMRRVGLWCCPRLVGRQLLKAMGGRMRLMIIGGAKADVTVLRSFNRMGLKIVEGYGLTECAPVVSVCRPDKIKIGSIGPAIGGIEVRIARPNTQGVGELQVRGPITFRGYWKHPEATAATYEGDWLKTGDLATLDEEGYISICGRAKALIVNREGKNIYPEEVEQTIAREPLVREVIIVAYTKTGETGENVGAIVSPNLELFAKIAPDLSEDAIEQRLRKAVQTQCKTLANYKHPRKLKVSFEPLVLTSTQKVKRHIYAGTLDE